MKKRLDKYRKQTAEIIDVRTGSDWVSHLYDFVYIFLIIANLTVSVLLTYDRIRAQYEPVLLLIERITVTTFLVDYLLRLWAAKYLYPEFSELRAVRKYVLSFTGIVDLLSFLPYFLPVFFPSGAVAFRMLRIMRVFRLFRINAYYDSFKLITEVLSSKKQQLFSSVFTILILMLASSLCMYSLEHEAQPEVFSNAFSGIWWAASTLDRKSVV